MKGLNCVICTVTLLVTSSAFAKDMSDAAFAKACPADAAWAFAQKDSAHHADAHFSNAALRSEIDKRFEADQSARNAFEANPADKSEIAKLAKIDQSNLIWLEQQIDKHGFPSLAEVGHTGTYEAFILTQHADHDPAFQAKVLELIKPLADNGDISKKEVAFLTDRVLVAEGKSQRYGTQFGKDASGKRRLRPVEDVDNLDKRRTSMDLEPQADYECRMDFVYGK